MSVVSSPLVQGVSLFAAVLAAAPLADASTASEWLGRSERALEAALRNVYPDVAQWTVEPLVSRRHLERLDLISNPVVEVGRLGKRSSVRVKSDERREALTVWFSVSAMQRVVAAREHIASGRPLSGDVAVMATHDVLATACRPLAKPETLEGMRARRPIRAGEPICAEAIEPRPAVGRGERVVVHSIAGPVSITTTGLAEQDGRMGERLRIKNPASSQSFLARVTAIGEVSIDD